MSWVAIGAAAVSVVGGYINSRQAAKGKGTASGQSGWDPQVQAGSDQAIQAAEQYANAPFQALATNQAVAGLSQGQIAAQTAALDNTKYIPQWQQTAGQQFNQQNLQQYMSPYTQDVVQAQGALATQQYQQQKAALDSQQAMTGAFGGDRSAVAQSQLAQNYNLNLQNIAATGLNNAYNAGVGAFNADRGYGATQAANAGSALQATGATAQQTQQAADTYNYNTFQQQLNWGKQQNAYLAQILGQVPKGSYYTGNQTQMTDPAGGGLGGALAGVGSILNSGFGSGGGGGSALGASGANSGYAALDAGAQGTIDSNQQLINNDASNTISNYGSQFGTGTISPALGGGG